MVVPEGLQNLPGPRLRFSDASEKRVALPRFYEASLNLALPVRPNENVNVACENPTMSDNTFEPKIIGFMCNWCSYRAADLAGTARIKYAPNLRIIRVMCSGRIDPTFVLQAFALGADGVMMAGCHPGECHYVDQNYKAMRRHALLQHMLQQMGIEPKRLRLVWASAAEGQHLADAVNQLVADVRQLGPLNWQSYWQENGDRLEALQDIVKEHEEAMEVQS
jgi:F420-non-reducing hydrogenase iron-sulfur subunit